MNHPKALRALALALSVLFPALSPSFGLVVPEPGGRFSALEVADPSTQAGPAPVALKALEAADPAARPWGQFLQSHGAGWEIYLDARSGAPLLVQGQGIPWIPGPGNTLAGAAQGPGAAALAPSVAADSDAAQGDGFGLAPAVAGPVTLEGLASSLRTFVARNRSAFLADEAELVLSREGSGSLTPGLWRVGFDRQVGGIPVTGDRLVFYIGQGNLIAFGATRWSRITTGPDPALGAAEARARLYKYLGLGGAEPVELVEPGSLAFTPLAAPGSGSLDYGGPVGAGYATALTWRIALRVGGGSETWVGLVDARTGAILAFYDDNKYARVKGGMLPITSDGQCPDGCEQPGYSMPFANLTIGGSAVSSNFSGIFSCSPAGTSATTSLSGPYIRVSDACGAISQSVTCDADLDLGTSAGTDCTVPAGSSAGNTHAARTGFYHLNRIKEHARAWLPSNTWLKQQLTDNVNINNTCNGFWDGSTVNFYRSGSSCRNTGEIAAVFLHEWGHGMDNYDGGGYDNPSEAYADVAAYLMTHSSCIGRGFRKTGTCGGYGNSCLTCSGVREADWNLRANHAPSTPEGFIATCPSGGSSGGPCGKEVHCEGYLISETLWDLATRDLPASGLDQTTAWALHGPDLVPVAHGVRGEHVRVRHAGEQPLLRGVELVHGAARRGRRRREPGERDPSRGGDLRGLQPAQHPLRRGVRCFEPERVLLPVARGTRADRLAGPRHGVALVERGGGRLLLRGPAQRHRVRLGIHARRVRERPDLRRLGASQRRTRVLRGPGRGGERRLQGHGLQLRRGLADGERRRPGADARPTALTPSRRGRASPTP